MSCKMGSLFRQWNPLLQKLAALSLEAAPPIGGGSVRTFSCMWSNPSCSSNCDNSGLLVKFPSNVSRGNFVEGGSLFASNNVVCGTVNRYVSVYSVYRIFPRKFRMNLKHKVHYPETGEYTVKPLKMTKLGGRHPETGRVIYRHIGGGAKRHYRWVDFYRTGPTEENSFLIEKVVHIQRDPNKTAMIALVGEGDRLRYIIASENMKAGQLIKTTSHVYRNPIRPEEGDAYPIGSLPLGTKVHCLEPTPGWGGSLVSSAGACGILMEKDKEGRILVKLPSKRLISCDPHCMATVGRVSNVLHKNEHVGSPMRARWLGHRPHSGLWTRKTGYDGRKIHAPKPPLNYDKPKYEPLRFMMLTLPGELQREVVPKVKHRRGPHGNG